MSDPYNVRLSPSARRALLAAALCAGCTDAVAPVDRLVPLQIIATPDLDTLKLADSLVLTVASDTARPLTVVWTVEPRGDSVMGDTMIYRPAESGTEFVRARATFSADRVGTDVRRVVVRPNAAPLVVVAPDPLEDFTRIPLGDTLELTALVTDPDGDTIPPDDVRWYRVIEGTPPSLLTTGTTLRIPVIAIDTIRIRVVVTDGAGGTTIEEYLSTSYDPISPALWRVRPLPGRPGWVRSLARLPSGLILAHDSEPRMGWGATCYPTCTVAALTTVGAVAWSYPTTGAALMVGDDGGVYLGRGDFLVKLDPDGTERWRVPPSVGGLALLQNGDVAVVPTDSDPKYLRVLTPEGVERWSALLDWVRYFRALAVGADSTMYVLGQPFGVAAYRPDGGRSWFRPLSTTSLPSTDIMSLVPADDSTLLVAADSLYALRADGSTRWARPGFIRQPVVGNQRAYVAQGTRLFALALVDGQEVWEVLLDSSVSTSPVLAANGLVIVGVGSEVIAFDIASGQQQWRHRLASTIRAPLLLTDGGMVLAGDELGYVEALAVGAGPLDSPWPMLWADERRTGRGRRP